MIGGNLFSARFDGSENDGKVGTHTCVHQKHLF